MHFLHLGLEVKVESWWRFLVLYSKFRVFLVSLSILLFSSKLSSLYIYQWNTTIYKKKLIGQKQIAMKHKCIEIFLNFCNKHYFAKLYVTYLSVVSNKITEVWQNVAVYDDQDFTVYTLRTFPGESAAVCGNMCTKDSRCLSFTWNKLKLMCKMFSKIFYTIAQSKSIGNRYFKRKGKYAFFLQVWYQICPLMM